MKYWIEQEEWLLRRNCNYRREKLRILHQFLCRDLDRDSQVSFAIEGSELVMALKMMVVATWIVEGNSLKCVPRRMVFRRRYCRAKHSPCEIGQP